MAQILDGRQVAATLNEKTRQEVKKLAENNCVPALAIIRIGTRIEDISYERGIIKQCESTGIQVKSYILPEIIDQETLIDTICGINSDPAIHGCLIFRPLPPHIDSYLVCNAISADKDVDGITDISLAGVFAGKSYGFPPCTASACMEILNHFGIDPAGKRAVVVGRSLVSGKSIAMMLTKKDATVTICHRKTAQLPSLCREADILVMAAGQAELAGREYLNAGQVVIDVGINAKEDGKLCGDVVYALAEPFVKAITPVPGGVGAVTVSILIRHVVNAAKNSCDSLS